MFHLIMCYTVSKHKSEVAARRALKQLQGSGDDLAFVVEFPSGAIPPLEYKTQPKKEKSNGKRRN